MLQEATIHNCNNCNIFNICYPCSPPSPPPFSDRRRIFTNQRSDSEEFAEFSESIGVVLANRAIKHPLPLPPQKALPHLRFLLNLPLLLHCSLNHNAQSAKLAKQEHEVDDKDDFDDISDKLSTSLELIRNG